MPIAYDAGARGLLNFNQRVFFGRVHDMARDLKGQMTPFQGDIMRANQRALNDIKRDAVIFLDEAIRARGRRHDVNKSKLSAAIRNPNSHTVTPNGFAFMVDRKVRPIVAYYRAIERGSFAMVGRTLPFTFAREGGANAAAATGRNAFMQGPGGATVGGAGHKLVSITIKNPIRPYRYGQQAAEKFLASGNYKRYVKEETATRRAALRIGIR